MLGAVVSKRTTACGTCQRRPQSIMCQCHKSRSRSSEVTVDTTSPLYLL